MGVPSVDAGLPSWNPPSIEVRTNEGIAAERAYRHRSTVQAISNVLPAMKSEELTATTGRFEVSFTPNGRNTLMLRPILKVRKGL